MMKKKKITKKELLIKYNELWKSYGECNDNWFKTAKGITTNWKRTADIGLIVGLLCGFSIGICFALLLFI